MSCSDDFRILPAPQIQDSEARNSLHARADLTHKPGYRRRLKRTVWFPLILSILACGGIRQAIVPSASQVGQPVVLSPGTYARSLSVGGRVRTYLVHVPDRLEAVEPAVVLVFHGGGGNAQSAVEMTGFDAQSEASGFIVVYPNGTGRLKNLLLTWNAGGCCGYAQVAGIDDVEFVRALIEDLARLISIDRRRIYATGISNGALMSYRLACELSDQIAAIAPVSGTQNVERCLPSRPISVIHFHGTADENAPFAGGIGDKSISQVDFASVRQTIEYWVAFDGCPAEAITERSGDVIHERYGPCDQGTAVELFKVIGGGHAWPGGQKPRGAADTPTQEISATSLSWGFFSAHPMP